jgi:hypothetical protein
MLPAIVAVMGFSERPVRFGLGVGAMLIGVPLLSGISLVGSSQLLGFQEAAPASRSFFGIYKILYDEKRGLNLLLQGMMVHGAQSRDPALANQPRSIYYAGSAFGDLFQALADKLPGRKVALVGLGTGALTCYGTKDSKWTYYEIDPLVEKIARDSRYFTYLRDCPPQVNVVIGDARLRLRMTPNHQYALILVDAFSSTALPTHLLTREAIAGYMAKLAPNGVLALHITNRSLNLEPVVGNLARDAGLVARINVDMRGDKANPILAAPACLALLARHAEDLGTIITDPRWRPLVSHPESRVWSDDYVDIFSLLLEGGAPL